MKLLADNGRRKPFAVGEHAYVARFIDWDAVKRPLRSARAVPWRYSLYRYVHHIPGLGELYGAATITGRDGDTFSCKLFAIFTEDGIAAPGTARTKRPEGRRQPPAAQKVR